MLEYDLHIKGLLTLQCNFKHYKTTGGAGID